MPKDTTWSNLPQKIQTELSELKGDEAIGGLLGSYLNNKFGDKLDIGMDSVKYSPNDNSSYSLDYSPGNIRVGAKWNF